MARQPLLEVAEKELPRHDFRLIRVVRTVGICHWALARRVTDDRLVELEIYDRALTSPLVLTGFVNRTPIISQRDGATVTRFPIDQINTDRMLVFVRPWLAGEPLHQIFLRSSRMPAERVSAVIASAGKVLRYALQQVDTPMVELSTNLFLGENDEVALDATVHPPWTLASDADRLLAPMFRNDDSREDAAKRFLLGLYVKLVTGRLAPGKQDLTALQAARMLGADEYERILHVLENPDDLYWLDEKLVPARSRLPWAPMVVCAVAVIVGGTAAMRHQTLSGQAWAGEEGMPVVPALMAAPAAFGGGEDVTGTQAVTFVAYRLAEARREAKAGSFDAAFALVDELAQQRNVNGDERLAIQRTRSEIQAAMSAAFTDHMDRSRGMYEAGDELGALRLLDATIATFPQNAQTKDATELAAAIRAVQRERTRRALNDDLARRQESARRQKEVLTVLGLDYGMADRRYRGRLRLAQERLANTPAVAALQQLEALALVEEQLLHDFLATAAGPSREALAAACTPGWAGKRPIRINEIRAGGIVEFRPEGLAFISWKSVTHQQFLQLFQAGRGLVAPDDHDYTLRLYQYAVRRQLPEAKKLQKQLAGTRHQQAARASANVWSSLEALLPEK